MNPVRIHEGRGHSRQNYFCDTVHASMKRNGQPATTDTLPCTYTYFYTPPLKCGEVLCYTFRCLSVCPSVRPCSPYPIDNLSIYSRNFFKFCIYFVIGDEWYGIVNGQNPSIFNGVTALFRIGKMVSGLLFLYCSWYLNETSQICCTSKVTYCEKGLSLWTSQFVSYLPLIGLKKGFWPTVSHFSYAPLVQCKITRKGNMLFLFWDYRRKAHLYLH